jgi:transposase
MLIPPTVRVFVAVEPADMRGSFDALAGRVRRMGLDPVNGHLYVFLSRRRQMAKALWFDGSGWCIHQKRLAKGTFELPPRLEGVDRIQVDAATLAALLEGIDLRAPRRRWYRRMTVAER